MNILFNGKKAVTGVNVSTVGMAYAINARLNVLLKPID